MVTSPRQTQMAPADHGHPRGSSKAAATHRGQPASRDPTSACSHVCVHRGKPRPHPHPTEPHCVARRERVRVIFLYFFIFYYFFFGGGRPPRWPLCGCPHPEPWRAVSPSRALSPSSSPVSLRAFQRQKQGLKQCRPPSESPPAAFQTPPAQLQELAGGGGKLLQHPPPPQPPTHPLSQGKVRKRKQPMLSTCSCTFFGWVLGGGLVWGGGAGCCFARQCRIPVTIFFCRQQAHTWQSCCFPASALSQLVGEPLAMCVPPPSPGTPKLCPPVDGAAGRGQGKGAGWWCCKAGGDSPLLSWAEGGR